MRRVAARDHLLEPGDLFRQKRLRPLAADVQRPVQRWLRVGCQHVTRQHHEVDLGLRPLAQALLSVEQHHVVVPLRLDDQRHRPLPGIGVGVSHGVGVQGRDIEGRVEKKVVKLRLVLRILHVLLENFQRLVEPGHGDAFRSVGGPMSITPESCRISIAAGRFPTQAANSSRGCA